MAENDNPFDFGPGQEPLPEGVRAELRAKLQALSDTLDDLEETSFKNLDSAVGSVRMWAMAFRELVGLVERFLPAERAAAITGDAKAVVAEAEECSTKLCKIQAAIPRVLDMAARLGLSLGR